MSQLPNYQIQRYLDQAPLWQYLDDLYSGSESWTLRKPDGSLWPAANSEIYLPRFFEEEDLDYRARLIRTPFSDRFAAAIRDFVGLILHNGVRFSVSPLPERLGQVWDNLNGMGASGESFLSELALTVMRRGHSFVLVDVPRNGGLPYWVHVAAKQVINWRFVNRGGQNELMQATIQEQTMQPSGLFGEEAELSYRVLTPGRYDLYTIATDPRTGKQSAVYHADRSGSMGLKVGQNFVPLARIPLHCIYGGTQTGEYASDPPLKSLADLNHTHYQLYSDHLSKIHLCCFPVAVRIGSMGAQDKLVLGPGVIVDAPPGGSFVWAEPGSNSIEQSRKEIEALEVAMDFLGVQYLVKPSDRQAASVSLIQAAKVESSLELFMRSFVSGLNETLATTCLYLGLEPVTMSLDTKFFAQGTTDPNLLTAILALFAALPGMPEHLQPVLLELVQRRGYFPLDFDLEQFDSGEN
jgi:Domain of unknown function (DUF4055)